jgi:hypothetical protein
VISDAAVNEGDVHQGHAVEVLRDVFLKIGKSFLVETGTIRTDRKEGIPNEPKFEQDGLELEFNQLSKKTRRSF